MNLTEAHHADMPRTFDHKSYMSLVVRKTSFRHSMTQTNLLSYIYNDSAKLWLNPMFEGYQDGYHKRIIVQIWQELK